MAKRWTEEVQLRVEEQWSQRWSNILGKYQLIMPRGGQRKYSGGWRNSGARDGATSWVNTSSLCQGVGRGSTAEGGGTVEPEMEQHLG